MNKIKRTFSIVMLFIVIFSSSVTVFADVNSEELFKQVNASMNRSADYNVLISVYSALKTTGFSDYESAAILVNMNRESSIRPDAEQGGGKAIGLIQWDGGRRVSLQKFSQELGDTKFTLSGYNVGDIGTQVAFILEELEVQNQWGGKAPSNYTSISLDEANKEINDTSIDLTKTVTKDEWRAMTNVVAMSLYFTSQFERCGYGIDIFGEGAKQAPEMYKVITGADPSTESDKETNESIANALALSGIWSEKEFVNFCGLTETVLEFPNRDDLSDEQIKGVVDWKNNIDYENDDGFIRYLRVFVMLAGIVFLVWIVLIYLSYWFDRINNFVDIDLLPMITFGRLRVAPEEHECTFNPKSFVKGQAQTVNHKVVICVCLIGLFFAVLVISGHLYTLLNALVRKMLSLLGAI